MRNKHSILCLALLGLATLFSFNAPAQVSYGEVPLLEGGTNNIAATQTNSYIGKLISAELATDVGLFVSLRGITTTPGDAVATFVFDKSLDGVNFPTDTGNRFLFNVTLNDATNVTLVTNLSMGSIGYLRLREIRSTNSVALTNIVVTGAVKQRFR
jgi:hypothetical protein